MGLKKINIGDAVKITNNTNSFISNLYLNKIGLVLDTIEYKLKSNSKIILYHLLVDKTDNFYFENEDLTNLNP